MRNLLVRNQDCAFGAEHHGRLLRKLLKQVADGEGHLDAKALAEALLLFRRKGRRRAVGLRHHLLKLLGEGPILLLRDSGGVACGDVVEAPLELAEIQRERQPFEAGGEVDSKTVL